MKYLVVVGVKKYNNIENGFMKSLCAGESHYDNISHKLVKLRPIKVIVFCDNDPSDYFVSIKDLGFISRMHVIENGVLID